MSEDTLLRSALLAAFGGGVAGRSGNFAKCKITGGVQRGFPPLA